MGIELDDSFSAMLLKDVFAAIKRREASDNQSSRRDLVRTSFAAIEGLAWIFREHIMDVANSTYGLTKEEELALAEVSYQVSERGKINTQPKFLPLIPQIRLLAKIATRTAPAAHIDFSAKEWNDLREAISIRNRITHPKSATDLELDESDVLTCLTALFWLLEETSCAMEQVISSSRDYLGQLNDVLEKLRAGDPETNNLYHLIANTQDQG